MLEGITEETNEGISKGLMGEPERVLGRIFKKILNESRVESLKRNWE